MVRQVLSVLLFALVCDAHAAQLIARISAQESRLGEPLMLQVEARGRNLSLDELELSALATDFEVFNINRSREGERAQLEATLYPLRAGTLIVPAIAVNGIRSKPLAITVSEDSDLTLASRFAPDTIYERQRSILLITLRDKADRQWTPPAKLEAPGLLLRPLGEKQFEEGTGPERVSVRELRWEVLGLKRDRYALSLPMLDGYQLGRHLRVPLPRAPLEIRALPSYLPVTVPVGKPSFTSDVPRREGKVGQALLWVLRVSAAGFTPEAAQALLHLPRGEHSGARYYPASFREEAESEQGPHALRIEIPLVPLTSGALRLPALNLPYFDPHTQRVEQIALDASVIKISDPLRQRVITMAAGIAAVFVAGLALRASRRCWHKYRARRAALERVANAGNVQEMTRAVCAFSAPPHSPTLRQWLTLWPSREALKPLVDDLERACFSARAEHDLRALKQRWLGALKQLRIT